MVSHKIKLYLLLLVGSQLFFSCNRAGRDQKDKQKLSNWNADTNTFFSDSLQLEGKPFSVNCMIRNDTIVYYDLKNNSFQVVLFKGNFSTKSALNPGEKVPFIFDFSKNEIFYPKFGGNTVEVINFENNQRSSRFEKEDMFYVDKVKITNQLIAVSGINGFFIYARASGKKIYEIRHDTFPAISSYIDFFIDKQSVYLAGIQDSVYKKAGFTVRKLDGHTYQTLWTSFLPGKGVKTEFANNTLLLVRTNLPDCLYAINKENGKIVWKFATYSTTNRLVLLGENVLWEEEHSIKCLNVNLGTIRWKKAVNHRAILLKFQEKLFLCNGSIISELNRDTGNEIVSYNIADYPDVITDQSGKDYVLINNKLYW